MESTEKNTEFMEEPKEALWKTILKFVLKAAVAVGIILWLVHSTGDKAKDWLTKLHDLRWWWLIPACALYFVHLFANAWRWHLLLKTKNIPCTLWEAFSLTMQSFFFSLAMPGGAIGGDVVRAGFLARALPKERVFDGVFTILMDRFTGMIGIFLLALLMLPFAWWCVGTAGGYANVFILVLLAGSLAGIVASIIVFQHKKLEKLRIYRKLQALADRFTHGLFSKVAEALDHYQQHKKEIVICIISSVIAVNLVLAGVMYCVCLAFADVSQVSVSAALGSITIGNIAGLIPATPSGVGMRDYFVLVILQAAKFPGDPLLPAIVMTLVIIGCSLSGGIFFLFSKHPKAKKS